jgi:hypothetical protein
MTVSGPVTIEASTEEEAKAKFQELINDEEEFCHHIQSTGDDNPFLGGDAGEVIYETIRRVYMDRIEGNPEEFTEKLDTDVE